KNFNGFEMAHNYTAHYNTKMDNQWCYLSSGLWEDTDTNYNTTCITGFIRNLDIREKLSQERVRKSPRVIGNPQSPTDMMLLKKEQKDAELDKKIEALRKKNEALMKRYQEVEEDKKRAEQEGMALQSRKGKVEDLTITINKSPTALLTFGSSKPTQLTTKCHTGSRMFYLTIMQEKRVVTKKGSGSTSPKGLQEQGEGGSAIFSSGRGKRRQLLGKRVVSERVDRRSPTGPVGTKHSTEDEGDLLDTTAGARNCLNTRGATGAQCSNSGQVGRKQERKSRGDETPHGFPEYDSYLQQKEVSDALHHPDLDAPTSSEEQLEYLRWKREREEIDRERVARHKNSQGQWRRAWDMDKPELMFSEKVQGAAERGTQNRGGRNGRRGHLRSSPAESRGNPVRQRDKRGKNVPVVGSKAKGKDRLTGRARRWDVKVEDEQSQVCFVLRKKKLRVTSVVPYAEFLVINLLICCESNPQACADTSLEEFLEELDALCEPEVDSNAPDTETQEGFRMDSSADAKAESQHNPTESNSETSGSKSTEKKVRFSEDLIQGAYEKNLHIGTTENKASSLKNTSQANRAAGEEDAHQALAHNQDDINNSQEQELAGMLSTVVQTKSPDQGNVQEMSVKELPEPPEGLQKEESENEAEDATCYSLSSQNGSDASDSTNQELLHSVEHVKSSSIRSTEELIDTNLSVLSLESGDPLPDHSTSTDKARENGKVV
ncbi:hypothetical protein NFI96_013025, partial [Prochilodus magdalenae]